jgi:hypothetical protein
MQRTGMVYAADLPNFLGAHSKSRHLKSYLWQAQNANRTPIIDVQFWSLKAPKPQAYEGRQGWARG